MICKPTYSDIINTLKSEKLNKALQAPNDSNSDAFNLNGWTFCNDLGLLGLTVPQKYHGAGLSFTQAAEIFAQFGICCSDNGLSLSLGAHIWAGVMPIYLFGNETQKEALLEPLIKGNRIIAHCVTEEGAGSDLTELKTVAIKDGDSYRLTGKKIMITNAPIADHFIVLARTGSNISTGLSAFIIDKDMAGISISEKTSKMGLNSAQMGEVHLSDCKISAKRLLGIEGQGFNIFVKSMELERTMILAPTLGRMAEVFNGCLKFVKQRTTTGKSLEQHQYLQNLLVEMDIQYQNSRNMLFQTTGIMDKGRLAIKEAAMTKLLLSEAWQKVNDKAMSIYGGRAYIVKNNIEMEMRDSIGSRFYSGTHQTQYSTIFNFLQFK